MNNNNKRRINQREVLFVDQYDFLMFNHILNIVHNDDLE